MKKVAIDTSGISDKYGIRGAGFYTKRLINAFGKMNTGNLRIDSFDFRKQKSQLKKYQILHYPYFDPFFLTLPINKIHPTIVTVHDLIPLKFPRHFPRGVRGEIKWRLQKFSLKSVKKVITDSEASKKDILQIIGGKQERIKVVYLAAGEEFKVLDKKESSKAVRKYTLPEKYILYVGDLNWNKNLPGLIEAFSGISSSDYHLIIVGKAFMNENLAERIALVDLIKKKNLKNKVKFLGFIPTNDLVGIYNSAACLVQPSFYEGFGLPVLEAMACGCPVICSNISSLPEIAQSAALMTSPEPTKISLLINKLTRDNKLRKELILKGFDQVARFSWKKTAGETLSVYEKVTNES